MKNFPFTADELAHMKPNELKAFKALYELGAPVKLWHIKSDRYEDYRGPFWLSAEEYLSSLWLDYYDKFWGCDTLNEILDENGLYFEWYNPAYATIQNNY